MQDTKYTVIEYERYKDFDFSGAKPIQNPKILEARARKQAHDLSKFFDYDVIEAIKKHDNEHDRQRANTILRALFT